MFFLDDIVRNGLFRSLWLKPFCQDYNLASRSTYFVYVNFIHEWQGIYSLKTSLNDRFLDELLICNFIYLLLAFVPEICWDEVAKEILFYVEYIWPGVWTVVSISQHPAQYLDLISEFLYVTVGCFTVGFQTLSRFCLLIPQQLPTNGSFSFNFFQEKNSSKINPFSWFSLS